MQQSRLQTKIVRRGKDGHFTWIKGMIHQEEIPIFNIYAPNIGAYTTLKQH
jgi:hypothetical protein